MEVYSAGKKVKYSNKVEIWGFYTNYHINIIKRHLLHNHILRRHLKYSNVYMQRTEWRLAEAREGSNRKCWSVDRKVPYDNEYILEFFYSIMCVVYNTFLWTLEDTSHVNTKKTQRNNNNSTGHGFI